MNGGKFYRWSTDFTTRCNISHSLIVKYPQKIPVIAFPLEDDSHYHSHLQNTRFVVSRDDMMVKFFAGLKEKVKFNIKPDAYHSTFLFIERHYLDDEKKSHYDMIFPIMSVTVGEIYRKYANPDGFLYVYYGKENTFG